FPCTCFPAITSSSTLRNETLSASLRRNSKCRSANGARCNNRSKRKMYLHKSANTRITAPKARNMTARGKREARRPWVTELKAPVALLRNYDRERLTYHQFVTKFFRSSI